MVCIRLLPVASAQLEDSVKQARRNGKQATFCREWAGHLRANRGELLGEVAQQIRAVPTLDKGDKLIVIIEIVALFDDYLNALDAHSLETLESYFARKLPIRLLKCNIEVSEVFRVVLLLQAVFGHGAPGR